MAKATRVPVKKEGEQSLTPAPWNPWQNLRSEIDEVFDRFSQGRFFDSLRGGRGGDMAQFDWDSPLGVQPKVDVSESDKAYTITAELPGMDEDDIELVVHDDVLILKGEKKAERVEEKEDYRLTERRYGRFQRSFVKPHDVEASQVKAKFKKGVLNITLPKSKQAQLKKRRIPIKSD